MGYSATVLELTVNGVQDEIVLEAARLPAVMEALEVAEGVIGDHISWCDSLDNYDKKHGDLAAAVANVFADYGWEGTEANGAGDVVIGYWSGDKLGSCWDEMCQAMAVGVDPKWTIEMLMVGEDSEMWGERIHGGECVTRKVKITMEG